MLLVPIFNITILERIGLQAFLILFESPDAAEGNIFFYPAI